MSVNEDHDRPGKWIVKRKYKDRAGNEKWTCKRGFDSYENAKEWEKEFLKSIDYASEKYPKAIKDITLTRFFYDYYIKTLESKESKQQAISKFERKIKPYLGDKFLLDITGRDVLTWQSKILQENKKSEKPYAETTLHGFRNTLTAIYNFAERKYKIPNPCSRVQSMGVEDFIKPYDFWTPEEYLEFRKYVTEKYNDSEINLAYDMVYYGGLAKGELVALKADDIQENTVTIKGSGKDSTRARFGRSFKIPLFLSEAVHYFITTNHRKKLIFSTSVVEKLGDILKEYQEDGPKRKKILLKEIQYSHVFLLIISGCTDTEIANRQGRNVRIIQKRFSKLFESEEAKRYLEEAKAGKIDYPYRLPARLMPQQDSLYIPKDTEQEPQNQPPEEKRPSLGNMVNVYGYRVENNALVVDKEEAIAVRRLFKIFRDGEGANCGIVARCLTDEYGYKKRNGSAFTSTDVSKIWQRKELYQGKYQEKYGQYKAILPDPLSSVADYQAFDPEDYQPTEEAVAGSVLPSCADPNNAYDTGNNSIDEIYAMDTNPDNDINALEVIEQVEKEKQEGNVIKESVAVKSISDVIRQVKKKSRFKMYQLASMLNIQPGSMTRKMTISKWSLSETIRIAQFGKCQLCVVFPDDSCREVHDSKSKIRYLIADVMKTIGYEYGDLLALFGGEWFPYDIYKALNRKWYASDFARVIGFAGCRLAFVYPDKTKYYIEADRPPISHYVHYLLSHYGNGINNCNVEEKETDSEKDEKIEYCLPVEEAVCNNEDVISERSNGKEIVMPNETMKKIDVIASDGTVCTFNRPNKKWWEASGLIRIADMLNGNVAFRTRGSRKIILVRMYSDTYANDEVSVNNQKVMSIKLFFTKQYAFANPCISTLFSISAEDVFAISDELDCDVVIQTKGENKEEYELRPVFEENENKPNEVPNDIPRSDEKNKPVDIDSDELPF